MLGIRQHPAWFAALSPAHFTVSLCVDMTQHSTTQQGRNADDGPWPCPPHLVDEVIQLLRAARALTPGDVLGHLRHSVLHRHPTAAQGHEQRAHLLRMCMEQNFTQVAATQIGARSIAPGLRAHMSCCRNHNVLSQEQQCASSHPSHRHLCSCAPRHSKVPFPHTHTCRKRASSSLMDSRRLSSSSFFSLSSYVEGSMLGKMRSRNGSRNSRNGMTCNRSHGGRVEVLQVAADM